MSSGILSLSRLPAHRTLTTLRTQVPTKAFQVGVSTQWRQFSVGSVVKKVTTIGYEGVKKMAEMPSDDVLLIDVREPEEVIQGSIPSSVNLPLSSLEKTLELHPDDFLKQNGFPKPGKNQKIVFYCRSGKRSGTAGEVAGGKGWKNVQNYEGSYLDWMDKQQK